MYKLHKVDAVHGILQRVVQSNLNTKQLIKLVDELKLNGYEEDNIHITETNKIHEEGDEISISKHLFDSLPDEGKIITDPKKANAKRTIRYIFGVNPSFPLKATLKSIRTDNDSGQLIAEWENPADKQWKETSVWWLESIGFEFDQPKFKEIPIAECDDSLLSVNDLIVKYLMKQNNWTEEKAIEWLKPVRKAMERVEAVFYQP